MRVVRRQQGTSRLASRQPARHRAERGERPVPARERWRRRQPAGNPAIQVLISILFIIVIIFIIVILILLFDHGAGRGLEGHATPDQKAGDGHSPDAGPAPTHVRTPCRRWLCPLIPAVATTNGRQARPAPSNVMLGLLSQRRIVAGLGYRRWKCLKTSDGYVHLRQPVGAFRQSSATSHCQHVRSGTNMPSNSLI
jgi:hypothetical protein